MSAKTPNPPRSRDWRAALAELRPELPAAAEEPFDFANEEDWERALRFAHEVIRAAPGSRFPPGSPQHARNAVAFALQWATANAVHGLARVCEGLIRLGGEAAKKAGTEKAIRLGAMYLLKFGDRAAIEEFICQDYGSLHAATAFLMHLDEDAIRRLREPLLQKLQRDTSPAIAAKIIERLAAADAHGCAQVLLSVDRSRMAAIWRAVSKRAKRELREANSELAAVVATDRAEIGARASQLSPDDVRALRMSGTDLAMLHWLRYHGDGESGRIAANKIREHREHHPARPTTTYRVNTRLPLHRLASSWHHEDRRFALEQAPTAIESVPLFSTLILDSDVRIASRAFELLAQVSPDAARRRAPEVPKLVSTRSLRSLTNGATTDEITALLDHLTRAQRILPAEAVLVLLGASVDPWVLARHLAREGNGGGLGVLAAFHIHRADAAALTRVADLACSSVAAEERHDVIRTALAYSFRAWRYANNVGAALSALAAALADTDYRTAYGLSLKVLGELDTALAFPRVRRLREALADAATLCAVRLRAPVVEVDVDGYVIERGDGLVAQVETRLVEALSSHSNDACMVISSKGEGSCTLSLGGGESLFQVSGYLDWAAPPKELAELTEALGHPQQDRLRDYMPLMRRITNLAQNMSPVDFGWALATTSTHDADYFEKELSKLAFWVHSLKNSLRAFANARRPSPAIKSAVERYRAEAQRLLGVFGFHENPVDEEFDVRILAEEVLANYRPAAQARGITLSTSVPSAVRVLGPARHLERILSNFVANAVDAVPVDGHVEIDAELDTSRYELTLAVLDDGPGVATELPTELFDNARRDKRDAVHFGMGLFEARQLALELNGSVELGPREKGGTVARITVPIELPDEP